MKARLSISRVVLISILVMPVAAQEYSAGVLGGGGVLSGEGTNSTSHVFFGFEASVGGTEHGHGVFFDYVRWPFNQSYLRSEDVVGVGWRGQWKTQTAIPFVQVGLSIITSRYTPKDQVHTDEQAGLALRGGVMFPLGGHLYVRPTVRADMAIYRQLLGFNVAFGCRF